MPCRTLALAPGSSSGRQLGARAGGLGPVLGSLGSTASSPALSLQLSERDWLRGVERLWESELQHCDVLERYYLARQRTVFAGTAGWPVVASTRQQAA
jgi:hypothetical protein